MRIFIEKNKKSGDKKAFSIIKKQILTKPSSLIGLAVGKTTDGLYKLINNNSVKTPIFWRKTKLFQIDENIGFSPDSKLSFNREIKRELKNLLKIVKKNNVFFIDGAKNPAKTIKEGYKFIRKNKCVDLIILGLGPKYDPHIAYNTSGKSTLKSAFRVVDLHPRIAKKLLKKNKKLKGITLGIKDILQAKKILLIAYGEEKAPSVKLALNGNVNLKKASASSVTLHKNLDVVLDKYAAKYLKQS
jgi:glucosamine-6-phosphate deaminase